MQSYSKLMFNLQAKGYALEILTITEDPVSTFVKILGPCHTRVKTTGVTTKKPTHEGKEEQLTDSLGTRAPFRVRESQHRAWFLLQRGPIRVC